jgi:hypothetical protein
VVAILALRLLLFLLILVLFLLLVFLVAVYAASAAARPRAVLGRVRGEERGALCACPADRVPPVPPSPGAGEFLGLLA